MPGQFQDWVRQVTTDTGNGTLALGAAVTGFRTFATAGYNNNDQFSYTIFGVDSAGNPSGEWEVGTGLYVSATPAIQRQRVMASSNANALVSFSAGTKHVIIGVNADLCLRAWGVTSCRLSLDTAWSPTADITSSSTLRLLPGPGGGQATTAVFPLGSVGGAINVGSGISLTLPTAEQFGAGYTCGITSGSVSVTHSAATAVPTGCLVIGTGIPTGTYVLASTTTGFTMSRPATATNASAALTFYYSIYDVYLSVASAATDNRDAATGMQAGALNLVKWASNTTPSLKTAGATSGVPAYSTGASGGVYVGTIQYHTTTASRDTAAHRALYNQFNQLPRRLFSQDATGNYTYTTASWRIANGDYNNQVEFVIGGSASGAHHGHGLDLTGRWIASNSAGGTMTAGLITDLDSTPTAANTVYIGGGGVVFFMMTGSARKTDHPGIGYHRVYSGELGAASGSFRGGSDGGNTISGNILG